MESPKPIFHGGSRANGVRGTAAKIRQLEWELLAVEAKKSLYHEGTVGDGIRPSNWQKAANFGPGAAQKADSVTQQTFGRSGPGRPVASRRSAYDDHEALDDRHRDLVRAEAEDVPAAQSRLQILLQIGVEPGGPVVAAVHPDAAFHLDEATRRQMRKIGPPTSLGVEAVFPLKVGAAGQPPEPQEGFFEAGAWSFGAEAEAGH